MTYRFAIVGCGSIAARHAAEILAVGELAGVCDTDPVRSEDFSRRFGAPAYATVTDLVTAQRPDIVCICSPNGAHVANAMECIDAGIDILCEKPLTNNLAQGRELVRALRASRRKLYVVKQNRYNPPVMAVKKLLDQDRLGRITGFQLNCFWNRPPSYYSNSWRGKLVADGGTLFTQFSHFIDLLYWFLGDVREVQGWRANLQHRGTIEFEDTGIATLLMASGALGTLHYTINASKKNMEGSFTLFGEKGTVKIGGEYLNRLEYFAVEGTQLPDLPEGNSANAYGSYRGSMSNHGIVYRELIHKLRHPEHPFVEAEEALKSVEIIERIYSASPLLKSGA